MATQTIPAGTVMELRHPNMSARSLTMSEWYAMYITRHEGAGIPAGTNAWAGLWSAARYAARVMGEPHAGVLVSETLSWARGMAPYIVDVPCEHPQITAGLCERCGLRPA